MTHGLYVFIVVLALDIAGLLIDLSLYLSGHTTITQYVHGGATWLGLAIVVLNIVGVAGIACHFFPGIV